MLANIVFFDDCYKFITSNGRTVKLTINSKPLTRKALSPGTVPSHVVSLFGLHILLFESNNSSTEFWFLNENYEYSCNNIANLEVGSLAAFYKELASFVCDLTLLIKPADNGPSSHTIPSLSPFHRNLKAISLLPASVRLTLLSALYSSTQFWPFEAPKSVEQETALDAEQRARMSLLLSKNACEFQDESLRRRSAMITSPWTGRQLTAGWSFVLDHITIVYPFIEDGNPIFLATGTYHSVACLVYAPQQAIACCRTDGADQAKNCILGLLSHVLLNAEVIAEYLASNPRACVSPISIWHLGHHLINELTGLDRISRGGLDVYLDQVVVANPQETQHYGPVEYFFPRLAAKLVHIEEEQIKLSDFVYKNNLFVVRVTDNFLSSSLASRIAEFAAASPSLTSVNRHQGEIRIVFGLRFENRTWINQQVGIERIIRHLRRTHARVFAIIDGHNVSNMQNDKFMRSFREERAEVSPISLELGIVKHLAGCFCNDLGVEIINCVGMTVPQNLAQVEASDFFIAPWGAGLVKYRWIYNKFGIILCSNWNRNFRRDLWIYESEECREGAIKCLYLPEGAIEDLPDVTPLVDNWGIASFYNYRVDEEALLKAVDEVIEHIKTC